MNKSIKIVSDGTMRGTRILNADGQLIPGACRVEILPIDGGSKDYAVRAVITFELVAVEMWAEVDTPGEIAQTERES
ncbi:hypothetical protein ACU4HD_12015 [Cupriavidus basilensis]